MPSLFGVSAPCDQQPRSPGCPQRRRAPWLRAGADQKSDRPLATGWVEFIVPFNGQLVDHVFTARRFIRGPQRFLQIAL